MAAGKHKATVSCIQSSEVVGVSESFIINLAHFTLVYSHGKSYSRGCVYTRESEQDTEAEEVKVFSRQSFLLAYKLWNEFGKS